MTFGTLLATIRDYKQAGISNPETLTTLLNDAFGDWLASQGVSHLMMLGDNTVCLNVRGKLKHANPARGIKFRSRFLVISLDMVEEEPETIAEALKSYTSDGDGAYVWVIPDGYMAALTPAEQEWEEQGGGYFSHESICISNTADIDTRCLLEVLYEDPAMENVSCEFDVPAHRSVHYRLDKLKDANGEPLIAKDAPVSYKITSRDARVVVQGSRILTSGENSIFASFGTVMAWCPQ
ncbi:MAG: sensory rhodopsin transducer [Candidatus Poribacteria bacterium]|nr:sensory rhodopsin transducer [Candidatus Poribacteria bacterium]